MERDAAAACYLWEGVQRGKEAGALALLHVATGTGLGIADERGQEILQGRLSFMLSGAPAKGGTAAKW